MRMKDQYENAIINPNVQNEDRSWCIVCCSSGQLFVGEYVHMQIFSEKAWHKLHLDKNSKDSSPTSLEKSSLKNFTLSFESQEVAICYIHIGDH